MPPLYPRQPFNQGLNSNPYSTQPSQDDSSKQRNIKLAQQQDNTPPSKASDKVSPISATEKQNLFVPTQILSPQVEKKGKRLSVVQPQVLLPLDAIDAELIARKQQTLDEAMTPSQDPNIIIPNFPDQNNSISNSSFGGGVQNLINDQQQQQDIEQNIKNRIRNSLKSYQSTFTLGADNR